MSLLIPLLMLLGAIPLVVALLRANELFYLKLRGGRLHVARGRIPQKLLNDLGEVLRDPPVPEGTLRGVVEDRRVRLYAEAELTDAQRQRLRNIVGGWPVARVRQAR
jgi:hypothetical protein